PCLDLGFGVSSVQSEFWLGSGSQMGSRSTFLFGVQSVWVESLMGFGQRFPNLDIGL
uniref:Uncharacterized protein n=1 Tax=Cannabis sativa TaxID=3483 RepID=A0A803QRD1_CANSA